MLAVGNGRPRNGYSSRGRLDFGSSDRVIGVDG